MDYVLIWVCISWDQFSIILYGFETFPLKYDMGVICLARVKTISSWVIREPDFFAWLDNISEWVVSELTFLEWVKLGQNWLHLFTF